MSSSSKKPSTGLWSPPITKQREFWLKMKKEQYSQLGHAVPSGIAQALKHLPPPTTDAHQIWCLSIVVSKMDFSPTWGSHWGLALHPRGQNTGFMLHAVIAIGTEKYKWDVQAREGDQIFYGAEGYFWIAQMWNNQVELVRDVMKMMDAPWEEGMQCQDWVMATVLQLEKAELVPEGLFNSLLGLREHSAEEMEASARNQWTRVSWKGPN
jgi:hypothetical protein